MDATEIMRWARACAAAYNAADPDVLFAEIGLEVEARISVGDVSAFAVGDDQVLGIVGPGTQSLPNILRDAEFALVPFEAPRLAGDCRVHRGFLGWLEAIEEWLGSIQPRGRRVIGSGHSAFAAAMTLATAKVPIDQLVTFGSPRAGNIAFSLQAEALSMEVVRVVHHRDVITTVPGIGYRHVGRALTLDDHGQPETPPEDLAEHAMNTVHQVLATFDGEAERDHHIDSYVTICAAAAGVHVD